MNPSQPSSFGSESESDPAISNQMAVAHWRTALDGICSGDAATVEMSDVLGEAMRRGAATASVLADWGAPKAVQMAGHVRPLLDLLPADDNAFDHEWIRARCGEETARICAMDHALQSIKATTQWRGKPVYLDRVRCYVAAYRDWDVALIYAAQRWSHALEVRGNKKAARAFFATGRHVLAPFLEMLGMNKLHAELLSWINGSTSKVVEQAEWLQHPLWSSALQPLRERVPYAQLLPRKYTHIHKALLVDSQGKTIPAEVELLILAETREACYRVLYWLHELYTQIDGALVDTIGSPALNGYRAIKTACIAKETLDGSAVELRLDVTICTPPIHAINEWGLAAIHWRNANRDGLHGTWWQHADDSTVDKLLAHAPGDLKETLHVFSPHGEIFAFNRGATVIDYAYAVHSRLAHSCSRFLINGEPVEPATVLRHLDLVELEHDSMAPGPTRVWLNAAHTGRARSAIDRMLRRKGKSSFQGQTILDREFARLTEHYGFSIPDHRIERALTDVMQARHLTRREALYSEIASGQLAPSKMLHKLFEEEITRQIQLPPESALRPHQLKLMQCCKPRPGDDIVGRPYMRRNTVTSLRIHRTDCPRLEQGNVEQERVELKWRFQPHQNQVAQIEFTALDDDGLLIAAAAPFSARAPRITLHHVEADSRNGIAQLSFVIDVESREVIDELVDELRRLPGYTVDRVRVLRLPPSQQEAIFADRGPGNLNPYSRLPVNERGMFFGRVEDVEHIRAALHASESIVWLRGHKRVGKTSLLLHLRDHALSAHEWLPIFIDFQLLGDLRSVNIFYEIARGIYNELRHLGRASDLGAPLPTLFHDDPLYQFIDYVKMAAEQQRGQRLVLLLDEFTRITDAYLNGVISDAFFHGWRGVLHATAPQVSYVAVVQQTTYDSLFQDVRDGDENESWHLFELGEMRPIKPLGDEDARRLIHWPIRNYLDVDDTVIDRVHKLTGGSPFLIQAFCGKLVGQMVNTDSRRVEVADVEAVRQRFLSPDESVFAHLLDLVRGDSYGVAVALARQLDAQQEAGVVHARGASASQLSADLPALDVTSIERALTILHNQDIIKPDTEPSSKPDGEPRWRFDSVLFREWLAVNSVF